MGVFWRRNGRKQPQGFDSKVDKYCKLQERMNFSVSGRTTATLRATCNTLHANVTHDPVLSQNALRLRQLLYHRYHALSTAPKISPHIYEVSHLCPTLQHGINVQIAEVDCKSLCYTYHRMVWK